jgi:murein DD-endopeptidase MepM/ murein hydrolase activator NlpD
MSGSPFEFGTKVNPTRLFLLCLALASFMVGSTMPVMAQEEEPEVAYYLIQEGDYLWDIAARFGTTLEDLKQANGVSDPDQLSIGDLLVIPGLDGFQGRVDTMTVPLGETLHSLSRRYRVSLQTLIRLNRLVSPSELFAGATLVIPAEISSLSASGRTSLEPGRTLLELAVLNGVNPWQIATGNQLSGTWNAIPGDVLSLPGRDGAGPGALPSAIPQISLEPLALYQGKTAVIRLKAAPGLTISGSLVGSELNFFPLEDELVAFQGIHAMTEPGLYPLTLNVDLPGGEPFVFTQSVLIRDSNYPFDPPLSVDPETFDPAVTTPEDEQWQSLATPVTPEKLWQGSFESPVPAQFSECWTSLFGSRRSYNGSPYDYFHSGLDFCGSTGTDLYAPAAGKVVFAGPLTVRGNATVIDHGWGIYTAYDHQSQIFVRAGDLVQPGQLIGLGGATGRTTGPHLHWEVWVGGVQVDPMDWLERNFPWPE